MTETTMHDEATPDFSEYIRRERKRLDGQRRDAEAGISYYEDQLRSLKVEFSAIDAYERAKKGGGESGSPKQRRRAPRQRRWNEVRAVLNEAAAPMKRADLLTRLGVKGDRAAESSVSATLNRMMKLGAVIKTGDGWAIPHDTADAADPTAWKWQAAE